MTDPKRSGRLAAAAALALALLGTPVAATGAGTDLVFDTSQMAGLEAGRTLAYAHERVAPASIPEGDLEEGRIRLSVEPHSKGLAAHVALEGNGRLRRLDPLPAGEGAGNPVLLVFLEQVTRDIAKATGGSPFYLRNRVKDAFRAGGEVRPADDGAARVVRYRPFEADPNGDKLGAFGTLTLAFTLSEAAPGRFVALEASTGGESPVYREAIRLIDGTDTGESE